MFDTNILIFGMIFSSFGLGYLIYARQQKKGIALISGLILMSYSLFVTNIYYLIAIGIFFIILPFIIKI